MLSLVHGGQIGSAAAAVAADDTRILLRKYLSLELKG